MRTADLAANAVAGIMIKAVSDHGATNLRCYAKIGCKHLTYYDIEPIHPESLR